MSPSVPRETSDPAQLISSLQRYLPELSEQHCELCARHYALLCKWNQTHNLTRITAPDQAALLHYVDSLLPLLELERPTSILDIGSGTGLPGVVAAILWPDCRVVLLDSSSKKVSFLRAARSLFPGSHIEVVHGRCEEISAQLAELVLIRATFQWPLLPALVSRHIASGGRLLAYLGQTAPSESEWSQAVFDANLTRPELHRYRLPVEKQLRHAAYARKE